MSYELDDVTKTIYIEEVKQAYQQLAQEIRDTVRVKNANGAKIVQFPVMGKGLATQRQNVQTPIPLMNISHDPKTATVTNWTASEMTDIFKNRQVPFDERQELVKTVKAALARRLQQIVIDCLNGGTYSGTGQSIGSSISGVAANLTLAALQAGAAYFDDNAVPEANRTWLAQATSIHALTKNTQVTSMDFQNMAVLQKGGLNGYYGFNFIKIPTVVEGGLPLSGTDRTHFAYDKDAVGLALNMDIEVTVDWEPSYGAWRTTGYLSAGAVIIDPTGTLKATCSEA